MSDRELRQQLAQLLSASQAHMDLQEAAENFPPQAYNLRPPTCAYTFWHLLEHIRICQWDVLEYIRAEVYRELRFPDDYWPAIDAVTGEEGWSQTLTAIAADTRALTEIVLDESNDLYAPLKHSGQSGHHLLREALIVADHNAYHLGEFAILRSVVGAFTRE